MRKKNYKGRCEKRILSKCKGVCRTYDSLQYKYSEMLETNENVKEFCCNVELDTQDYTTDFVCTTVDDDISYYEKALRARATIDMLIGSVSQVALNHIGLLIVDEIQNVVNSKNGKSLVGALTQLINNSGISICMVGTPESSIFFEQAMQLARRSLGLQYGAMKYDEDFRRFCNTLLSYRYG